MRYQVERTTFDAQSLEDVPLGDRVDIAPHLGDQKLHTWDVNRHFQPKPAHIITVSSEWQIGSP